LPGDDGASQVDQCQVAQVGLLISHKDLAKAVHPRMTGFHHPTPGTVTRIGAFLQTLFTARANMGCIAALDHGFSGIIAVIGLVRAQVLRALWRGFGTSDNDAVQDLFHLGDVMPIGPGKHDGERGTAAVDQEVSFGPHFFPGPSGFARPTLVPEVPWSWLHRCFASPRQFL